MPLFPHHLKQKGGKSIFKAPCPFFQAGSNGGVPRTPKTRMGGKAGVIRSFPTKRTAGPSSPDPSKTTREEDPHGKKGIDQEHDDQKKTNEARLIIEILVGDASDQAGQDQRKARVTDQKSEEREAVALTERAQSRSLKKLMIDRNDLRQKEHIDGHRNDDAEPKHSYPFHRCVPSFPGSLLP